MVNFCTLFDSNYAAKGLVMYESLLKNCSEFHLFIFAFDDKILNVLNGMKLLNATVISLSEFENERLLRVKKERTQGEYCWTCESLTILHCLNNFDITHCTYIDADLFFYSDPHVIVDEMGDNDVMITEHRYTPRFADKAITSGIYCVQFMTFKNNKNGLKVLNWWCDACIDWCYARYEDGKFGDQLYLDDWPTRFTGVHILKNLGGGVAPWNMEQYIFSKKGNDIYGVEDETGNEFKLIFFHFHAILAYKKGLIGEFYFEGYSLKDKTKKLLYLPYLSVLKKKNNFLKKIDDKIDGMATKPIKMSWIGYAKAIRRRILRKDNLYSYCLRVRS